MKSRVNRELYDPFVWVYRHITKAHAIVQDRVSIADEEALRFVLKVISTLV